MYMVIGQEDMVTMCAREVERSGRMVEVQHGRGWDYVPLDPGDGEPSKRTIAWMKHQGLLKNSGSGAGNGLTVDWEVAEAMGLSDRYNDS